MVTDDERLRVAERLRDVARAEYPIGEIGFTEGMLRALGGRDWRDMAERLADLIEPDCGTAEVPTSLVPERDGTRERLARALGIDLPALLALAEEMDAEKNFVLVGGYACRIREACGEVES